MGNFLEKFVFQGGNSTSWKCQRLVPNPTPRMGRELRLGIGCALSLGPGGQHLHGRSGFCVCAPLWTNCNSTSLPLPDYIRPLAMLLPSLSYGQEGVSENYSHNPRDRISLLEPVREQRFAGGSLCKIPNQPRPFRLPCTWGSWGRNCMLS